MSHKLKCCLHSADSGKANRIPMQPETYKKDKIYNFMIQNMLNDFKNKTE